MANIENEYLVKRGDGEFATIASLFSGVRILKMDGFLAKGKPVNIYTAQWVNSQTEDYMVTDTVVVDGVEYDAVFRENVDIDVTFIVSDKYGAADVRTAHDAFIAYMTDGALLLKSNYVDRILRCVCLKEYSPTTQKLKRPSGKNYIIGTITLHSLDTLVGDGDGHIDNPYPTPSGGGDTPTPTPSGQVSTTNVYDSTLQATQAVLNQRFNSYNNVTVSVSAKTLIITTSR